MAVATAALQQEMMVAAFMCRDIGAYNNFVLSHQAALQDADRMLLSFFQKSNPQAGFDDYNFYKTELANTSSLRSVRDPWFCYRANANFRAALGRSLEQLLATLPYPVDTGLVRCAAAPAPMVSASQSVPAKKKVRRRTWLGRLVDSVSD